MRQKMHEELGRGSLWWLSGGAFLCNPKKTWFEIVKGEKRLTDQREQNLWDRSTYVVSQEELNYPE